MGYSISVRKPKRLDVKKLAMLIEKHFPSKEFPFHRFADNSDPNQDGLAYDRRKDRIGFDYGHPIVAYVVLHWIMERFKLKVWYYDSNEKNEKSEVRNSYGLLIERKMPPKLNYFFKEELEYYKEHDIPKRMRELDCEYDNI